MHNTWDLIYGCEPVSNTLILISFQPMILGDWLQALRSDTTAIKVSLELCLTKMIKRNQIINSIKLKPILSRLNDSNQIQFLLQCDTVNRVHSAEWLTYTLVQLGDIPNSESIVSDLYLADNQTTIGNGITYIQGVYLSRTILLVELFHWFPYSDQFINISQRLYKFDQDRRMYMASNNDTDWFSSWCEAAYLLGE